ncbi:MAG: hydrogenase nickel incorporation protein HypB [Deltaproteobacteria bacterium]|nr:hydrogenase nickel incorporation protein HypB [Deltaproteobacteria bacterium]
MCDTCGCHSPSDPLIVEVNQSLLAANDEAAHANHHRIEAMGAVGLNLISSPGSGKTTLLEKTIEMLGRDLRIGVIEGDIETELDAERIRAKGVPVVQLTTGGACHLDAPLVGKGLDALEGQLDGAGLDLVVIENVGNLVCPATFALGEHQRVVLLSVPEGQDKPAKYPGVFRTSQIFLLTKTDLLPYFDFDIAAASAEARRINPALQIMALSATSGEGMEAWFDFLRQITK